MGCDAAEYQDGTLPIEVLFSSNSSGPPVLTLAKTAAELAAMKVNYTFGSDVYAEIRSPCYQKESFKYGGKAYGAVTCSISQGGVGVSLSIDGDTYDYGIITDQPRKVLNLHKCSFTKTDLVLATNTTRVDVQFNRGHSSRAGIWVFVVLAMAVSYFML